ncbi:MAG TPA: ligase-associated DNA damage response endonuclease PdeM [Paracoccaceae bacterium]|nr:ligase-associated DNA damage response endonuclease PdeM [Paracoccaceae bacterium]
MDMHALDLAGARLSLAPSGVLWWEEARLMVAGDLHLGRAERAARLGAGLLPPYETADTLDRLAAEAARLRPATLILLGDSFDDMAAADGIAVEVIEPLLRLAAGRRLVWIAGNHDPVPSALPGTHREEWREGPLVFRHIARPGARPGEISGHYHPKARLCLRGQPIARPCFLSDGERLILPAFGTYTGGLDVRDTAFDALLGPQATAYLTGSRITPLPRQALLRA